MTKWLDLSEPPCPPGEPQIGGSLGRARRGQWQLWGSRGLAATAVTNSEVLCGGVLIVPPAGAPSPTTPWVTIGLGNQEQPEQPATPADAPEPSGRSPGMPLWSPRHRRGARLRLAEKPALSHGGARPGRGAGLRPRGTEPGPPEVPRDPPGPCPPWPLTGGLTAWASLLRRS